MNLLWSAISFKRTKICCWIFHTYKCFSSSLRNWKDVLKSRNNGNCDAVLGRMVFLALFGLLSLCHLFVDFLNFTQLFLLKLWIVLIVSSFCGFLEFPSVVIPLKGIKAVRLLLMKILNKEKQKEKKQCE